MFTRAFGIVVALALVSGVAPAVQPPPSATVTTNIYSASSTSDDIANSCKDLSVVWNTGVLSAKCNYAKNDGTVTARTTSYDLDDAIWCPEPSDGSWPVPAWGSGTSSYHVGVWQMHVSSDGKNYHVSGACSDTTADYPDERPELDVGDTTDGLKNDGKGGVASR